MIDYLAKYKSKIVKKLAGDSTDVLDYGCGTGRNLKYFIKDYQKVYGYDILENIFKANSVTFLQSLVGKTFGLVFVANVLHHSGIKELKNIIKVTKDKLIIFEHNPYHPITRLIVKFAPIDKGVKLIRRKELIKTIEELGLKVIKKKYTLFFTQYYILAVNKNLKKRKWKKK